MRPKTFRVLLLALVLTMLAVIGHASTAATRPASVSTAAPVKTLEAASPVVVTGQALQDHQQQVAALESARVEMAASQQAYVDQVVAAQQAAERAAQQAAAKAAQQKRPVQHAAPVTDQPAAEPATVEAPAASGSVEDIIYQVFGGSASRALRIAQCESGLNPSARNSSGASGLFQIMMPMHASMFEAHGWSGSDWADPYKNAVVAFDLSSGGTNWGAWSCR